MHNPTQPSITTPIRPPQLQIIHPPILRLPCRRHINLQRMQMREIIQQYHIRKLAIPQPRATRRRHGLRDNFLELLLLVVELHARELPLALRAQGIAAHRRRERVEIVASPPQVLADADLGGGAVLVDWGGVVGACGVVVARGDELEEVGG